MLEISFLVLNNANVYPVSITGVLYMKLKLYLCSKRIKGLDFCKKIGCSSAHLYDILNGRRYPSSILAKSIENATNGEILAEDLLKRPKDSET